MAPALHKYPGINLPLRYVEEHRDGEGAGIKFYRCGSFTGAGGSISELLQVREVGMLVLMDRLTDKPNWNKKVFYDSIVAKVAPRGSNAERKGSLQEDCPRPRLCPHARPYRNHQRGCVRLCK